MAVVLCVLAPLDVVPCLLAPLDVVLCALAWIYLLRGVPIEIQRAARLRAAREETTLRQVLLRGLGEYAAGTWTPQADDRVPSR